LENKGKHIYPEMRRAIIIILLLAAPCPIFGQQAPAGQSPLITVDESPKSSPGATVDPALADAQKAGQEAVKAFEKGDMEGARRKFEMLLVLQPDNFFGLVNIAEVEHRLKLWDDAEKHLKQAVRVQPESARAWLALGALYCERDKLDEALAALSEAVLLDPKNPRAHNFLGVTVGKKGWYSGAEAELQRALELDPDYAEANFNLAVFYLQRSPPAVELARRHYNRALELGAAPDPLVEKSLGDGKK
jgi:tetratricopeptide (TPR) repeat protein